MRLIFITNFYPPPSLGGYELWCQEIAEGLRERGHDIVVLTSNYLDGYKSIEEPDWIHRRLHLEMEFKEFSNALRFFFLRKRVESENDQIVNSLLDSFIPDGICIWGMWNLSRSILEIVEKRLPGRVIYYMGDYWPFLPSQNELYWKAPAKNIYIALPKKALAWFAQKIMAEEELYKAKFEHILFPSKFMQKEFKDKALIPEHSLIVYGASDLHSYLGKNRLPFAYRKMSLLFVGRLEQEKGVHTAIQAAAILVNKRQFRNFQLRIVGSGNKIYEHNLREMVRDSHLEEFVSFSGSVEKDQMPELFSLADVFLFTSIWQEPFGRVIVEAMASGTVVVGTATGGSAEILINERTGLTYPPENADKLADRIMQLYSDPDLFKTLSIEGRKVAEEKFSTRRMAGEIEEYFLSLLAYEAAT